MEHRIGTLVTNSESVTSKYGDEVLFFRHQRVEDDVALKPEWKDYYPEYDPPYGLY